MLSDINQTKINTARSHMWNIKKKKKKLNADTKNKMWLPEAGA